MTGSTCLYEEHLLHQPLLFISSGEPGLLLEVTVEDLKRLLSKASVGRFGEPLSAIRLSLRQAVDDGEAITRAVKAFTTRRIQQRLEATIELPPLAESVRKLIQFRANPDISIDEVTSVVETDPALAAQLLSWASSSYYAPKSKIRSVEDAISRVLGVDAYMLTSRLGQLKALPDSRIDG